MTAGMPAATSFGLESLGGDDSEGVVAATSLPMNRQG